MGFIIFQKFDKKEDVNSFSEILSQNGIESIIENTGNSLDSNFGNSSFSIEYILKLQKDNFKKAEELLSRASQDEIDNFDKDYFLFDFSNEELKDVIIKKDEWGYLNYSLAQKILNDRGVKITEEQINQFKKERLIELSKPEESQNLWIIFGYIFAFLGGFLGVFLGWHLLAFKKTLPNGDKVYNYSAKDRIHGKRIFILGVFCMIFWLTIRLFVYAR